jgi:hypothetical protein
MKTHFVFSQLVRASLPACTLPYRSAMKTKTALVVSARMGETAAPLSLQKVDTEITLRDCKNIHYTYKTALPYISTLIAVEKIRLIGSLLFGFDVSQGHKAVFPIIGRTCFVRPDGY